MYVLVVLYIHLNSKEKWRPSYVSVPYGLCTCLYCVLYKSNTIVELRRQVLGAWVVLCPQVFKQTGVTAFSSAPLSGFFMFLYIHMYLCSY